MGLQRARNMMGTVGFVLLLSVACSGVASGPPSGGASAPGVPSAPTRELLYVANQDDATITVIDVETRTVLRTIDLQSLGFGPNAKPHHIVAEPDASFWYVSLIGESRIVKLDADDRVVGTADFEAPGMLALHPTEDLLYVGRSMSAVNAPRRIGIVTRSDLSVEEVGVFFPRPHAVGISSDGEHVYTGSLGVNQLGALDWQGDRMELVEVDGPPHSFVQFALSPDGRWMVATAEITGRLLVFDLADATRPRKVAEVEVGVRPWHPVFTPDSRMIFLGNKGSNTVSVVEVEGWELIATVESPGLDQPHGSAVSADGRWVFISSNGSRGSNGTVVVIDASDHRVVEVIEVGRNAAGLTTRTRSGTS